ncbi:aminoacyl-tRNA hydrolase [Patescibacteria group bacterium]|nr:aminoacyl-tRNA hydrolase [Patescibacteria group bacterium]
MSAKNCKRITDDCLIVGLGNPGEKYANTRHNVGYWIVEQLRLTDFFLCGMRLIKTGVSMNSSGRQVKALVDKFQVPLNNLIVVHDDLDVPLGEFRLQKDRGSAGHKGVNSIVQSFGTQDFWRLRVGIGRPPEQVDADEYVLSEFSEEEKGFLVEIIPQLVESLGRMVK